MTNWKSKSGWASNRSGASLLIASSNRCASSPGIPYHVLVSPQCTLEPISDREQGARLGGTYCNLSYRCNDPDLGVSLGCRARTMVTYFVMPTEGGEQHPHIGPRDRHARYIRFDVPQHGVLEDR